MAKFIPPPPITTPVVKPVVKPTPFDYPKLPEVWITKYALTKGIYTAKDAELCSGVG